MGFYDYIRSMSTNKKDLTNKASNGEAASVPPAVKEILNNPKHDLLDNYCETLYSRYLNRNLGISDTRCRSLNEGVKALHNAVCYLDTNNLVKFDLNQSVGNLLAIYARLEDWNDLQQLTSDEIKTLRMMQETLRHKSKAYNLSLYNQRWDTKLTEPFKTGIY